MSFIFFVNLTLGICEEKNPKTNHLKQLKNGAGKQFVSANAN